MATSHARRIRTPKLNRSSNGMLMTPEEFDAAGFDERYRFELVHGVLIVSPFASEFERDPNEELGRLLRNYQESNAQGKNLDATLPEQYLNLPDGRRRADRAIWAGLGRLPDLEKDVPTIAVEFVSKTTRDRVRDYVEKRREYLELGVAEYWVIDRFARTMTVFRKSETEQVVQADAAYRTPLLPGFELPIARLFAVADAWKRPDKKRKAP